MEWPRQRRWPNMALLAHSTGDHATLSGLRSRPSRSPRSTRTSNPAVLRGYPARAQSALAQLDAAEMSLQRALALRGDDRTRVPSLSAERAYLAHLRQHPQTALALIEPVLAALQQDADLTGAEDPLRVAWISRHEVLSAAGDPRAEDACPRARHAPRGPSARPIPSCAPRISSPSPFTAPCWHIRDPLEISTLPPPRALDKSSKACYHQC